MYGANAIAPHLSQPGFFMYMDPATLALAGSLGSVGIPGTSGIGRDEDSEDKDYPSMPLSGNDSAEIDRVMESYSLIDSSSAGSSTVTTPTVVPPPLHTVLPHSMSLPSIHSEDSQPPLISVKVR